MAKKKYTQEKLIEKFWSRIEESTEHFHNGTPCQEWQGSLNDGYGQSTPINGEARVHRIAWTLRWGEIDKTFEIDHLCRNRACVNIEHLDLVTSAVNTQRGDSAKLTPEDVLSIRELYATLRYSQTFLAERFKVKQVTINHIVTGKTWKNVGGPITVTGGGRRVVRTPEWAIGSAAD